MRAFVATDEAPIDDEGVESNQRLTATSAAVIFVLLAVEGFTILSVSSMLRWHAFVGMLLIPPVLVKTGSTAYRAARYYLRAPAYRRRGAPPTLLRVLGPFVVVLTAAVLATGVILIVLGPGNRSPWFQLHKATFILWFGAMTVHVLGHLLETARVAPRDWRRRDRRVRGAGARRALVLAAVVAGVALGVAIQPSVTTWLGAHVEEGAALVRGG